MQHTQTKNEAAKEAAGHALHNGATQNADIGHSNDHARNAGDAQVSRMGENEDRGRVGEESWIGWIEEGEMGYTEEAVGVEFYPGFGYEL